jgi:hypothetical protein
MTSVGVFVWVYWRQWNDQCGCIGGSGMTSVGVLQVVNMLEESVRRRDELTAQNVSLKEQLRIQTDK